MQRPIIDFTSHQGTTSVFNSAVPGLQAIILLYVVPITVAATRWGSASAITAALASALGHDLLFVEPVGSLVDDDLS